MKLVSGLEIPQPQRLLWYYIDTLKFYPWYDAKPVCQNCTLSADDVWLSRQLGSRLTHRERGAILERADGIRDALKMIPPDIDLLDVPEGGEIPGDRALSELITMMCAIPGVKLAKTMKILHKKRPGLIPVIDSVVERHYWPKWVKNVHGRSRGDYAIALIRAFHRDMHSVADELQKMRDKTADEGKPLTPCRILDILIWSVSKKDAKDGHKGRE